MHGGLDHPGNEIINQVLSVAPVTSSRLVEAMSLVNEAALGGGHLERPQEAVHFLEVWPNGVNFMDNVLNTMDSKLTELLADHCVIGKGNSASIDLQESSLVYEFANSRQRWITESAIRGNCPEHLRHWAVHLQENAIM